MWSDMVCSKTTHNETRWDICAYCKNPDRHLRPSFWISNPVFGIRTLLEVVRYEGSECLEREASSSSSSVIWRLVLRA